MRLVGWSFLADLVPLYPLYALLFAHAGMSDAGIGGLIAVWSVVAVVAEVPAGALADRWSRRSALAVAGICQAGCFALWTAWPHPVGFGVGFALWGIGGSLSSGAREALLYDGLAATGSTFPYSRALGRVNAAGMAAQLPTAVAATACYALGGYALAGWASTGCCLLAAVLAARLPEPPRTGHDPDDDGPDVAADAGADAHTDAGEPTTWASLLRSGVREAVGRRGLRTAVVVVALLGSVDTVEEYFPLLAHAWGVPSVWVPLATVVVPLAGALGAATAAAPLRVRHGAGVAGRLGTAAAGPVLAVAGALLVGAAVWQRPLALVLVAVGYGLYHRVLVLAQARLQERIRTAARATATSVATFGEEIASVGVSALWAVGGLLPIAAVVVPLALVLPRGGGTWKGSAAEAD